jgi:hypothetical protein
VTCEFFLHFAETFGFLITEVSVKASLVANLSMCVISIFMHIMLYISSYIKFGLNQTPQPTHFNPDDGGATFLQNIGINYKTTWHHNPEDYELKFSYVDPSYTW